MEGNPTVYKRNDTPSIYNDPIDQLTQTIADLEKNNKVAEAYLLSIIKKENNDVKRIDGTLERLDKTLKDNYAYSAKLHALLKAIIKWQTMPWYKKMFKRKKKHFRQCENYDELIN